MFTIKKINRNNTPTYQGKEKTNSKPLKPVKSRLIAFFYFTHYFKHIFSYLSNNFFQIPKKIFASYKDQNQILKNTIWKNRCRSD